jgi:anti-sigma B factor antagonist
MEIVCNQDRLLKIFRITGLAKVFTIHDSEAAALSAR